MPPPQGSHQGSLSRQSSVNTAGREEHKVVPLLLSLLLMLLLWRLLDAQDYRDMYNS